MELVHGFADIEILVEALWLIYQAGTTYKNDESSIRYLDESMDIYWSRQVRGRLKRLDYDDVDFYTNLLTKKEEANPYLVVHALFKKVSLSELKSKLRFWFQTALTNPWEYAAMDKAEMADIYQTMNKVIEAVFVINELHQLNKELQED